MIRGRFLSQRHVEIMIAAALLLLAVTAYAPVFHFGFVNYDDPLYVTDNARVRAGWSVDGLFWAFRDFGSSNWHPLTWLSHMTDWELFGDSAVGHHGTNVVLHALNTILLFVFLRLMTGAFWRSACVAALFALHPLNVESVAWVAERKNLLSGFFGLLTLLFYAFYIRKPGWKRYLPVFGAYALGLTAKPMLVTLPLLLILLDLWPGKRILGMVPMVALSSMSGTVSYPIRPVSLYKLLMEKIPLIVLSVGSIVVTLLAAERGGALKNLEHFPLTVRLGNALYVYAVYLGNLFLPRDLAVFYPHPGSLPLWQTAAAGLLIAVVTALVLKWYRECPYLPVGWFWFLGTLIPVIGFVQVGLQAMADRYVYFPLIGLLVLLVWGMADLGRVRAVGKTVLIGSMVIILLCSFILTRQQLRHWQSSRTLFEHALAVAAENPVAHSNLAHALFGEGDWKGAEAHYRDAIRTDPKYTNAYANLGAVLARQERIDEAVEEYRKALALNPHHADAHYHLGLAMEKQSRFSDADRHYEAALRAKPDHIEALRQRGMRVMKTGDYEKAADSFQAALRIRPDDPVLKAALLQAVERRDAPEKDLDRKSD
jgi:tetratricopeptide (TPR) repeat protein